MKVARFVLKIIAMSLAAAAVVCTVIAYWDKLAALGQAVCGKVREKKSCICPSEYDDYVE